MRQKIIWVFVTIALIVTFCYPVFILSVILFSPTDEYKEFVYVDGREVSRIDWSYLWPNVLAAAAPFVFIMLCVLVYLIIRRYMRG